MSIKALFDSDAFFRPEKEIKDWIKHSKNYQGENPNSVHLLKFFSTSKQRTYLVATPARLHSGRFTERQSAYQLVHRPQRARERRKSHYDHIDIGQD